MNQPIQEWRLSREERERAAPGGGIELTTEESEQALAACWLIEGSGVYEQLAAAGFVEKAFTHALVRAVWRATAAVVAAGAAPGAMTVAAQLEAEDGALFSQLGGLSAILDLADKAGTSAHWRFFAEFVRDAWRCRQARWWLLKANEELANKAPQWKEARPQLAGVVRHLEELVQEGTRQAQPEELAQRETYWRTVADGTADRTRRIGLLPKIDERLGAIDYAMGDQLIVIAAGASVGKTSFARQMVSDGLARGQRWAVFLLETSTWDFCTGMAAQRTRVNARGMERLPRDLQEKLWTGYAGVKAALGRQLFVWDDVYEIREIELRTRALARTRAAEGGLHGVVIDYIQIARAGETVRRNAQREEVVAELARRCKMLAKEIACPVFALCQINRESQKENRPPRMSDLRESAALEHAADRILMLWCPPKDPRGVEQTLNQTRVFMHVLQTKNRYGPQGSAGMWLDRPWTLFSDLGKADGDLEAGGGAAPGAAKAAGPRPGTVKSKGGYGRPAAEDDGEY